MPTKTKKEVKRPPGRPIGTGGDEKHPHTVTFRPVWWAKVVKGAFKEGVTVNEYIEKHLDF